MLDLCSFKNGCLSDTVHLNTCVHKIIWIPWICQDAPLSVFPVLESPKKPTSSLYLTKGLCISQLTYWNQKGLRTILLSSSLSYTFLIPEDSQHEVSETYFRLKAMLLLCSTPILRDIINKHLKLRCGKAALLTIQQFQSNRRIHIFPPVFPISRYWNLPVRPLAGQVNAHTCYHRRLVLKTECSKVKTVA